MASLHIINTSPGGGAALSNCLRAARPGDTVVLIGDGVLCANRAALTHRNVRDLSWCALADDVEARGIGHLVAAFVRQIDDGTFVDLTVAHQPIVSWS
jgi:sulfur relay protein TusB/DsrH